MRRLLLLGFFCVILLSLAVPAADDAPAPPRGKPALLVIDVQNAYLPMMPEAHRTTGMMMVNYAIDVFRAHGCPVIRVYHTSRQGDPAPGTEPFEFPATVKVLPDDPKIVKNYPSAFKQTELEKILRDRGCDTVFLCGLSAVGCVLHTWFDAQAHDFRAFMIKDALISHRPDLTRSVEEITDAVGLDAVEYMLDSQGK